MSFTFAEDMRTKLDVGPRGTNCLQSKFVDLMVFYVGFSTVRLKRVPSKRTLPLPHTFKIEKEKLYFLYIYNVHVQCHRVLGRHGGRPSPLWFQTWPFGAQGEGGSEGGCFSPSQAHGRLGVRGFERLPCQH